MRLGEAAEELSLCGGVEDGLAIQRMYGDRAVWCCLGEGNLATVQLPPIVRRVVIYGDDDPPGREMANRAARVLSSRGLLVWQVFPKDVKDFNELLLSRGSELAA